MVIKEFTFPVPVHTVECLYFYCSSSNRREAFVLQRFMHLLSNENLGLPHLPLLWWEVHSFHDVTVGKKSIRYYDTILEKGLSSSKIFFTYKSSNSSLHKNNSPDVLLGIWIPSSLV